MSDKLNINHWDLMEKLLWMDSVRGYHSTGVTAVGGKANVRDTLKLAVDGAEFTQTQGWVDFVKSNANSKVLMGHNRWATSGAVNAQNAHPFTHSHITMMHNGTLVDQSLLPDSNKFVVDSDNIAYSLATQGLEKTISQLDGAYALVWHDSESNTINFIRNDERPLWFAKLKNNQGYAWASEKMMLEWLLTRSKKGLFIEEMIELPVGEHYSTSLYKKTIIPNTPVKYTLPTFTYNNWGSKYYGNYGKDYYQGTRDWEKQYQTNLNKYCDGLKVGEEIIVIPSKWEKYGHQTDKGAIHGKPLGYMNSEVEVVLSSMTELEFDKNKRFKAVIKSASILENTLRIYTKDVKVLDSDNVVALSNFRVTTDGTYVTSNMWDTTYIKTCYMCGEDKQFEELETCTDIDLKEGGLNQVICGDCSNYCTTH